MPFRKIILIAIIFSIPLTTSFIFPTRQQLLHIKKISSLRILDRNGILLREFLSRGHTTSRYCKLNNISNWLIEATIIKEDRKFFYHFGLDPFGIIRAIIQNIQQRKITGGGSTITMQLARTFINSEKRTIVAKIFEAFLAINIELKLSKEEILELYLNSVPYSNQTYGIEAAAYLYFQKPAGDLSLSEAVFLAVIPQAPSYYNPYVHPRRVKDQSLKLLSQMLQQGIIDSLQYINARQEPCKIIPKELNFLAPHFCQYILEQLNKKNMTEVSVLKTTLDFYLQKEIEEILKNNIKRISDANVTNAAAIVFNSHTMEILAYVGSVDFFNPLISGEVDGIRARRQPGSALKPFTYALSLETGNTAATLIPDIPTYSTTPGGDYTPRNYDEKYHGFVRMRTALACSYNIPAVRVCGTLGTDLLYNKLKELHFDNLKKTPIYYGIGLTLGNGEVTLLELTRAYSVFANQGYFRKERYFLNINNQHAQSHDKSKKIFSPEVAYLIADILNDNSARTPAFGEYSALNFPFFCAAKTGTSKNFRDNWCVGFTDQYLVGVWVGNFDGSSMHNVSGITGAGPIFRDIILTIHRDKRPEKINRPQKIVTHKICALSGMQATEYCPNIIDEIFIKGNEPALPCSLHQKSSTSECTVQASPPRNQSNKNTLQEFTISFPDDNDIFKLDPILKKEYQIIKFRLQTTIKPQCVSWFVDGQKIGTVNYPYIITWQLSPGRHKISASAQMAGRPKLRSQSVMILVLE